MKKETVADLLAALAEQGGPDCESVETLHEWVIGALLPSRSSEVELHVAGCPRCAAEVRLAGWYEETEESAELDVVAAALAGSDRISTGAASASTAVSPVATSPRWWARPWGSAALAVAATLLVVVGLSLFRQQPPPVGELPAGDVVRGAAPSIVEPRGALSRAPDSVRWQGDAAARYRVQLVAVDGTVLWSADFEGERAELPEELIATLAERVTYRLTVVPLTSGAIPAGVGDEVEFRILGDRS